MDAASVLLVVAAVGVNFGWQPDERDPQAYEVVVQLEPQLVDALQQGHTVPIDAHVPPGVAPIRKVRVVVGSGDVPRTPLAASAASRLRTAAYPARDDSADDDQAAKSQPTVVRGQDPGWSDDRYGDAATANSRRYEQLGPTIGVEPIRTAQAPPPLGRMQNAVVETGNTLRSGVEAGIQQANQQLGRAGEQLLDGANSVGREVRQQFPTMPGTSSQSSPSGWAPPPLWSSPTGSAAGATSSIGPATTSSGWTSIRPDLAPPRLLVPALTSSDIRVAGNSPTASSSGPSFPSAATKPAPLHSVLADPVAAGGQATTVRNSVAAPNWSDSWGSTPATGQATVGQPSTLTTPEGDRWAWPAPNSSTAGSVAPSTLPSGSLSSSGSGAAADDRYSQPATIPPTTSNPWTDWDRQSAAGSGGTVVNNSGTLPQTVSGNATSQSVAGQSSGGPTILPVNTPGNQATIGFATPASPTAQAAAPKEELPWWPFVGVNMGLVGSLAANLFLGWSYADARHKYRTLVRKTTHAFQKSAGVAA